MNNFTSKDYWRALILYGLNTATYKMAFAKCLDHFVDKKKTEVKMIELAEVFFDLYLNRLKNGMPQLGMAGRTTVMEQIVSMYNAGSVTRTEAIYFVKNNAFKDVLRAFHVFNGEKIELKFYEYDKNKLILSDNIHQLLSSKEKEELMKEVDSRWSLLEAAFQMKRESSELENNIRKIYLSKGYKRRNITNTIPVLNGYQKGKCFYCGETMLNSQIHVDHVIPRQFVYHDEIWNLVLAHEFCNMQKSDALPNRIYIDKLILRNEHFIASNHPIKNKLIKMLGKTQKQRKAYIEKVYQDAKIVIPYTWEGIKGYNPSTDEFYKSIIRGLNR
ncbi:HNH endonuclease [Caloranaerobacter ferrireducens]|uniref:HNH endonuclease n=1 Tax=Caloranaerobacter ferrireducens TaxID=1323370 RepID=UPI00084D99A2|nr:HNH endonuclease signature motif containing protein [Caloranaerobacter ferrireducens]